MTIYDWVTRFDSWRGEPAALLIMATAVFILLIPDARLAILGLAVQYLAVALLYLDVMEPRLVMVKLLVGWFVCLMLTITGSQVHWGLLPEDVSPDEVAGMSRSLSFEVKGRRVSITAVRALLALVMLGLVWLLGQQMGLRLPGLSAAWGPLNLAVLSLLGFGLLGLTFLTKPLRAGLGVLMFLAGLELYYTVLEPSITALALMAFVNLAVAVAISYLTQTRYAIATVLE